MNRLFRYFYVSDLIAVVGASISYIAIYWTCAQLLSPAAVSLVIGAVFVIRFISSSLVGPWIDRIEPVRLLKATVLIRCFLLVAVWYLLTQTDAQLVPLLFLLAVQTFLQVIGGNTAFKVVTRIVASEQLPVANAYLSTLDRVGTLAGLLAGGLLISGFSITVILGMEAVVHLIAWCLLFPLRSGGENNGQTETDLLGGFTGRVDVSHARHPFDPDFSVRDSRELDDYTGQRVTCAVCERCHPRRSEYVFAARTGPRHRRDRHVAHLCQTGGPA